MSDDSQFEPPRLTSTVIRTEGDIISLTFSRALVDGATVDVVVQEDGDYALAEAHTAAAFGLRPRPPSLKDIDTVKLAIGDHPSEELRREADEALGRIVYELMELGRVDGAVVVSQQPKRTVSEED